MLNRLFNNTSYLEKGLDAAWLRNEVIANNIANGDTPDFKSSHVEFESTFRRALYNEKEKDTFVNKQTRDKHISFNEEEDVNISPVVVENSNTTMRMDGNNVDIEFEQTELAKNQIYYNLLIQKLNRQFGRIKTAIKD